MEHMSDEYTTSILKGPSEAHHGYTHRRYFQHAHFIPIVGVGKRGAY